MLSILSYTQPHAPNLLETKVVLITAESTPFLLLNSPAWYKRGCTGTSSIRTIY